VFGWKAKEAIAKTEFDLARENQINCRQMGAYFPIPDELLEASDAAFEGDYKSTAFARLIPTFHKLISPIAYLHSSAKAVFLFDLEYRRVSPSEAFEAVSRSFFEIIDASIDDISTDLLILSVGGTGGGFDFDFLAEVSENDVSRHSLVRYHARLLREHLSNGGRGRLTAFRRAITAIKGTGLFLEDEVAPLALDFFPSLARREDELLERREALTWRPEEDGNRVVDL